MSGCGSTERNGVCRRMDDDDDGGVGAVVRRGSRVVISSTCTDHALLQPGQVGVVVEDDGSGTPFKVLFEGKTRWYTRAELRLADDDGTKAKDDDSRDDEDCGDDDHSDDDDEVCDDVDDDDDGGVAVVRRGSRVVISSTCTDHALLQPGQVGVVVEDDGSGTPFKVLFEGKTRWYTRAELRLADDDGTKSQADSRMCPSGHELESFVYKTDYHRCDLCRASISSGERGRRCQSCDYDLCPRCSRRIFDEHHGDDDHDGALLAVGCGVQLAPDFEEYSDAKEGPLKPGDIGVLIEDDGSSKPFRVEFDGKRWWYDRSALRVAELSQKLEHVACGFDRELTMKHNSSFSFSALTSDATRVTFPSGPANLFHDVVVGETEQRHARFAFIPRSGNTAWAVGVIPVSRQAEDEVIWKSDTGWHCSGQGTRTSPDAQHKFNTATSKSMVCAVSVDLEFCKLTLEINGKVCGTQELAASLFPLQLGICGHRSTCVDVVYGELKPESAVDDGDDDDDGGVGAVVRRGSRVVISSTCTDHALLQPGQVGVVVEDDGSGTPFKVLFEGKTRWYTRAELRLADDDGTKSQADSRM
jgi:hypothetical protein